MKLRKDGNRRILVLCDFAVFILTAFFLFPNQNDSLITIRLEAEAVPFLTQNRIYFVSDRSDCRQIRYGAIKAASPKGCAYKENVTDPSMKTILEFSVAGVILLLIGVGAPLTWMWWVLLYPCVWLAGLAGIEWAQSVHFSAANVFAFFNIIVFVIGLVVQEFGNRIKQWLLARAPRWRLVAPRLLGLSCGPRAPTKADRTHGR
jgi:hypothetical protein